MFETHIAWSNRSALARRVDREPSDCGPGPSLDGAFTPNIQSDPGSDPSVLASPTIEHDDVRAAGPTRRRNPELRRRPASQRPFVSDPTSRAGRCKE